MAAHRTDLGRGDLFWIDWSPARGSEQAGLRPGLVVQSDPPNKNPNYPNTIVVAVSRSGRDIPSHVPVLPTPENGLSAPSYVKCEQIQTISKERLGAFIGRLTEAQMQQVAVALQRMLRLS